MRPTLCPGHARSRRRATVPPRARAARRLGSGVSAFLRGDEEKNHRERTRRPPRSEHEIANSRHWTLKGYGGGPRKRGRPAARGGRCGGHSLLLTADRGQVRAPRFASPSDAKLPLRRRNSNRPNGPSLKGRKTYGDTMVGMVERVLAGVPARLLRRGRTGGGDRRAAARPPRRRRSTCASRSSTTSTSSGSWRSAVRSSSRARRRCPRRPVVLSAHGVAPSVYTNARDLELDDDRRDLPARDEGARRGPPLRGRGLHRRPDRPRRPRGGGRDDGRGARGDRPRPVGRGGRSARGGRPGSGRVHHADDALGRRDRRDHRGDPPTVPERRAPKRDDICYATSNRQWAVKDMLGEVDLLLVIGSRNSSNSNRLVEVARAGGVASYLIDDETDIDEAWLDGVRVVGITSGASAPEKLVERVCDWFRARGVERDRAVQVRARGRGLPPPRRASPRARARRRPDLGGPWLAAVLARPAVVAGAPLALELALRFRAGPCRSGGPFRRRSPPASIPTCRQIRPVVRPSRSPARRNRRSPRSRRRAPRP